VAIVVVVQCFPLAPQTSNIGPIAGGIGSVAVAIVVVVQSYQLTPQTTTIDPIAGGIGGVAVAIVVVVQLSPVARIVLPPLHPRLHHQYLPLWANSTCLRR
jgi:hypothetical protein